MPTDIILGAAIVALVLLEFVIPHPQHCNECTHCQRADAALKHEDAVRRHRELHRWMR